jgi:hypothetical protein
MNEDLQISLPKKRNFRVTLEGDSDSNDECVKGYCLTPPA